jgi:hypothetical protein
MGIFRVRIKTLTDLSSQRIRKYFLISCLQEIGE